MVGRRPPYKDTEIRIVFFNSPYLAKQHHRLPEKYLPYRANGGQGCPPYGGNHKKNRNLATAVFY
ncbi:MAG: hypothetical protein J6V99_02740 [Neisseriaceae bacterium]|nr:hypothetical protein [Neisseriaceae bacterium]